MDKETAVCSENKQLLAQWIARYSDVILRTSYVYLHDQGQAEDAVQETFLKAYQSLNKQGRCTIASEKAWLLRIAINVCHDYHRSRWFRYVDHSKTPEDLLRFPSGALPEDLDLLSEVYRLPENAKQVLLLYYYQEMTLQETAEVLGISRSAVHKRLQKAQKLLKGKLTGRDIDGE